MAASYPDSEGMQSVPIPPGLETSQQYKAYRAPQTTAYDENVYRGRYAPDAAGLEVAEESKAVEDPKIWGVKRKTFWIIVGILLVIIIAGAVGGGVGGALASKSSDRYDSSGL